MGIEKNLNDGWNCVLDDDDDDDQGNGNDVDGKSCGKSSLFENCLELCNLENDFDIPVYPGDIYCCY